VIELQETNRLIEEELKKAQRDASAKEDQIRTIKDEAQEKMQALESELRQAMTAESILSKDQEPASGDSTASNFTRGLLANKDAEIEKLRKELDKI